jgi:hypothetical protein
LVKEDLFLLKTKLKNLFLAILEQNLCGRMKILSWFSALWGCCGHMVVGFATTCAINAYHH